VTLDEAIFYVLVVSSFCCSGLGYLTREQGWYAVGALLAAGAVGMALVPAST
jgi:hypothetical protein